MLTPTEEKKSELEMVENPACCVRQRGVENDGLFCPPSFPLSFSFFFSKSRVCVCASVCVCVCVCVFPHVIVQTVAANTEFSSVQPGAVRVADDSHPFPHSTLHLLGKIGRVIPCLRFFSSSFFISGDKLSHTSSTFSPGSVHSGSAS